MYEGRGGGSTLPAFLVGKAGRAGLSWLSAMVVVLQEPSQDGRKSDQDGVPLLTTSFKESLTLTVRDEPMVLTPEAVKSLGRDQLCRLWRV